MGTTARIRTLSLLTTLAFVLNVFLPFFAVYAVPSAQAAEPGALSSILGEKILICASDGFKWVTWEELQQDGGNHPEPGKKHYECPLCYVSAHGLKDLLPSAATAFIPSPVQERQALSAIPDQCHTGGPRRCGHQTRAPPRLA